MKIRVIQEGGTCRASLIDNQEIEGFGATTNAAIGHLVNSHQELFGLEIETAEPLIRSYDVYMHDGINELRILCSNCALLPRTPSTGWEVSYCSNLERAKQLAKSTFGKYKRGVDCEHCQAAK